MAKPPFGVGYETKKEPAISKNNTIPKGLFCQSPRLDFSRLFR